MGHQIDAAFTQAALHRGHGAFVDATNFLSPQLGDRAIRYAFAKIEMECGCFAIDRARNLMLLDDFPHAGAQAFRRCIRQLVGHTSLNFR